MKSSASWSIKFGITNDEDSIISAIVIGLVVGFVWCWQVGLVLWLILSSTFEMKIETKTASIFVKRTRIGEFSSESSEKSQPPSE